MFFYEHRCFFCKNNRLFGKGCIKGVGGDEWLVLGTWCLVLGTWWLVVGEIMVMSNQKK
jgi:hypothetical protein